MIPHNLNILYHCAFREKGSTPWTTADTSPACQPHKRNSSTNTWKLRVSSLQRRTSGRAEKQHICPAVYCWTLTWPTPPHPSANHDSTISFVEPLLNLDYFVSRIKHIYSLEFSIRPHGFAARRGFCTMYSHVIISTKTNLSKCSHISVQVISNFALPVK